MGNVVMKASRSEAARAAVRADESNLRHARLQAQAMRRERCGGDADAKAPQAFKEGASTLRNAQNRTHISCSAAAWGVMGRGGRHRRLLSLWIHLDSQGDDSLYHSSGVEGS